jgi:hypothetical protein
VAPSPPAAAVFWVITALLRTRQRWQVIRRSGIFTSHPAGDATPVG